MLKLNRKQAGFTLLELLVVVAILAAIAGTTTIALRDTDARASAAAHVAMMDELNKGVRTFRVLRKNVLPSNFDSIIEVDVAPGANADANAVLVAGAGATQLSIAAHEDLITIVLNDALSEQVSGGGMGEIQYVSAVAGADPDGEGNCSDIEGLVGNTHNAVVAGNIFMSPAANGCGMNADVFDEVAEAGRGLPVQIWAGGYERVMGDEGRGYDDGFTVVAGAVTAVTAGTPILMAVGAGPSSDLFNQDKLGALTTVPVYRHVSGTEYNRFVLLFFIGEFVDATMANNVAGLENMHLVAVVDGAGDTKEEELGEWDGTRNTI